MTADGAGRIISRRHRQRLSETSGRFDQDTEPARPSLPARHTLSGRVSCRLTGVSNLQFGHPASGPLSPPASGRHTEPALRDTQTRSRRRVEPPPWFTVNSRYPVQYASPARGVTAALSGRVLTAISGTAGCSTGRAAVVSTVLGRL